MGGSSINSVLCSSSLVLLMQTHMTTSCSNFVVPKTLVYEFMFALHVYRTLWSWGDAHSAYIHSLFYTFYTYQEPFQIKLYFSFTEEFHGLTFPFLGQVSASVLHMSFMT